MNGASRVMGSSDGDEPGSLEEGMGAVGTNRFEERRLEHMFFRLVLGSQKRPGVPNRTVQHCWLVSASVDPQL